MAYNNHAASVSSHYSPDPDPQLINGVSTNPEDGDVTQDATQRRPTSGRDDTIGLDDCPDINAASKYNSANIKDESQNTQTKAHNVEADDQGEDETEAAVGDGHGAKNEAHEEPPEEEQDQMSERAQILRELSWDDLQQAFQEQMDKKTEEEEMLKHEFQQYTEVGFQRSSDVLAAYLRSSCILIGPQCQRSKRKNVPLNGEQGHQT